MDICDEGLFEGWVINGVSRESPEVAIFALFLEVHLHVDLAKHRGGGYFPSCAKRFIMQLGDVLLGSLRPIDLRARAF